MFPDLHHKMSKKIAQLTKVIYHLNTKNEDSDDQIEGLKKQHESEVDQILRDAAKKLNQFKDRLEKRQSVEATQEVLKQLRQQHKEQRTAALKEFEQMKKEATAREAKKTKAFQERMVELREEVDGVRSKFKARLAELSKLAKTLERKASGAAEKLKELARKQKSEIAELVKKSNKKYNDMLAEKLDSADALRQQLTRDFENKTAQLKARHGREVKALKEQLASERRKHESANSEGSEALEAMRGQMVEKIERLLAENEDLRDDKKKLSGDRSKLAGTVTALQVRFPLSLSLSLSTARSLTRYVCFLSPSLSLVFGSGPLFFF